MIARSRTPWGVRPQADDDRGGEGYRSTVPLLRRMPLTRRQLLFDVSLAVAHALFSLLLSGADEQFDLPGHGWVMVGAVHVALVGRRLMPLAAFGAVLALTTIFAAAGLPLVALGPAPLTAVFSVAAYSSLRPSLAALGATLASVLGLGLSEVGRTSGSTMVGNALMLIVAWLLGDIGRRRREVLELHRRRAEELEQAEGERAAQAVAEERMRIARELHDVVAHSMSVIAVQAGTARLAIDRDPQTTVRALGVIEETSREALEEMRRMLGLLRRDGSEAELTPAPGLSAIPDLVDAARRDGLDVTLVEELHRTKLAPGMEATAYRVVQEALSNVRRHAPGASTEVRVEADRRELRLSVRNDAGMTGVKTGGAGLGLIGLRERAAVYGGEVDAGPDGRGGWMLEVALPLKAKART